MLKSISSVNHHPNKTVINCQYINVDKAKAFPPAFEESQVENIIPINTQFRQQKYLNNIQEQDHRFTKRRVRQSQWFQSFQTARNTIAGYETMRKGQVKNMVANNVQAQVTFINNWYNAPLSLFVRQPLVACRQKEYGLNLPAPIAPVNPPDVWLAPIH